MMPPIKTLKNRCSIGESQMEVNLIQVENRKMFKIGINKDFTIGSNRKPIVKSLLIPIVKSLLFPILEDQIVFAEL